MAYRFHHVHLLCSDLEKSIAFFKGPDDIVFELLQA